MKRGFLLKAAAKKASANKRASSGKSKDPTGSQQNPRTANTALLPTSATALPKVDNAIVLPLGLPRGISASDAPQDLQLTVISTMPHIYDGDGSTQWITHGRDPVDQVMKNPGYPSRVPKPSRPDLYEVRTTAEMGQGVFAKRDIKRGEVVLAERPLLVSPNWDNLNVRQAAFARFEELWKVLANEYEKLLEAAFGRMDEEDKATYMSLWNSHKSDGSGPLLGIKRTNAFGATDLMCLSGNNDGTPQTFGGVCNIGSRINHSCMPNVFASFNVPSFAYRFRAVRDIPAGEQLFAAYCDVRRTKAERQISLAPYEMSCHCPACANATPATDKFRQTFEAELSRLHKQIFRPGLRPSEIAPVVSSLKALETQVIAEGLEAEVDSFITLLTSIRFGLMRLGNEPEAMRKYEKCLEEFYNMRSYTKPFRTWLKGH